MSDQSRDSKWEFNFHTPPFGKINNKIQVESRRSKKCGPHNANNQKQLQSINHLHNFVTIFAMQFLLETGFCCPVWFFVSLSLSFCLIQSNKWGVPLGRRLRPFYLHLLTARWDCCVGNCLWIRADGTIRLYIQTST